MFDALDEYEKISTSMNFMDKIEKVVTNRLAQKDKIIVAQRLSEVEMQRKHEEEPDQDFARKQSHGIWFRVCWLELKSHFPTSLNPLSNSAAAQIARP